MSTQRLSESVCGENLFQPCEGLNLICRALMQITPAGRTVRSYVMPAGVVFFFEKEPSALLFYEQLFGFKGFDGLLQGCIDLADHRVKAHLPDNVPGDVSH